MRARLFTLGLLILIAALVAAPPTAANPFTTPLAVQVPAPSGLVPLVGEDPMVLPVTVTVACAWWKTGPITLQVSEKPAWLVPAFEKGTLAVPADPRACSGDGYYHLTDTLSLHASPESTGMAKGDLTITVTRDDTTVEATVPVSAEALAVLTLRPVTPPYLLDEHTRAASGTILATNEGDVPLDVRIEAFAPPSVVVEHPTLPKRLDPTNGSANPRSWAIPITIRASDEREDPFTVRLVIHATPATGGEPLEPQTVVWSLAPPAKEAPAPTRPPVTFTPPPDEPELEPETEEPTESPVEERAVPAPALVALVAPLAAAALLARRRR